jgi:hypothetical protein
MFRVDGTLHFLKQPVSYKPASFRSVETEAAAFVLDTVLGLGVRPSGGQELVSPYGPTGMLKGLLHNSMTPEVSASLPACAEQLCTIKHTRFVIMKKVDKLVSMGRRPKFAPGLPFLSGSNRTLNLLQRLAGIVLLDTVFDFGDARYGANCFLDANGAFWAIDYDTGNSWTAMFKPGKPRTAIISCATKMLPNYVGSRLKCEVFDVLKSLLEERMIGFLDRAYQRLQNPFWQMNSCPSFNRTVPAG